jgi:hypothetical protein
MNSTDERTPEEMVELELELEFVESVEWERREGEGSERKAECRYYSIRTRASHCTEPILYRLQPLKPHPVDSPFGQGCPKGG